MPGLRFGSQSLSYSFYKVCDQLVPELPAPVRNRRLDLGGTMKLPMPVICKCGFATMDAKKAIQHAQQHEEQMIWECLACGTTFKGEDGEYKNGYLVCPSCWHGDLSEVAEGGKDDNRASNKTV